MDREAWWATVQGLTELDMTECKVTRVALKAAGPQLAWSMSGLGLASA